MPPAIPHLVNEFFQLLEVLCGGAVVRNRRAAAGLGSARDRLDPAAERSAGLYIMEGVVPLCNARNDDSEQ